MDQRDPVLVRLVDEVERARAHRAPLEIRGGGTKAFYGGAPKGAEVTIESFRAFRKRYGQDWKVVTVLSTPFAVPLRRVLDDQTARELRDEARMRVLERAGSGDDVLAKAAAVKSRAI